MIFKEPTSRHLVPPFYNVTKDKGTQSFEKIYGEVINMGQRRS